MRYNGHVEGHIVAPPDKYKITSKLCRNQDDAIALLRSRDCKSVWLVIDDDGDKEGNVRIRRHLLKGATRLKPKDITPRGIALRTRANGIIVLRSFTSKFREGDILT